MKFCYRLFVATVAAVAAGNVVVFAEAATGRDAVCLETFQDTTSSTSSDTCTPLGIPPTIDGSDFLTPKDSSIPTKTVLGCCIASTAATTTSSDVSAGATPEYKPTEIGTMPQFSTETSLQVLAKAREAWAHGNGVWPQMSLQERITAIEKFLETLQKQRSAIINVLMWEIGKNMNDATSEFDRTIEFCKKVIEVIRTDPEYTGEWQTVGSTKAFVRRAAIGIILALGPYNYPLNETYATIIPALLMGNIVLLKIPTIGGLVHFLTMEAFNTLPEGTIHFISGSGRSTMPPIMATGDIDGLAFIGGSKAADDLIKQHPNPHRLKVFLQLEANNMAIYLSDLFTSKNKQPLETALTETITGTLSFNGQRCTALKLLMVPTEYADVFAKALVEKVEALSVGLPWEQSDGNLSKVTPLPNSKRVQYMQELIADAVENGAKVINKNGGQLVGGPESTLMNPAVLYPVTSDMKIYHEEQFGPVIPIAPYDDIETVLQYGQSGWSAQQVSLFTDVDAETSATVIDRFSSVFGKINLNSQCGRSPDTLPFSGRRSSAMGVMSVAHALKEFSVPTVVAYKDNTPNAELVSKIGGSSKFLQSVRK